MSETLNTDGMTLQQIRELANQEQQAAAEPVEETVYRRRIVDGDGVERTYEGSDMESLLDSVIQGRAEHQPAPAPAAPKERTADEEFVRAQELSANPTKVFREMAAEEFGMPAKDVKSRLQKLAEYESNLAAETYVSSTPEFFPCPANGQRVQAAMKAANLEITVSNISKTVKELDAKGLLEHAPVPVDPYSIPLSELRARANGLSLDDNSGGF
jgi:hypothetical protein